MSYFTELKNELAHYLDEDHLKLIHQAYLVAKQAHQGQKRLSGEDYITHPVAAANILAQIRMDHQSIIATLLHDVIEDTPVTKEELTAQFGEEVAELVDGVSKLTQMKFATRAEAQAENFRKMVMAMVKDIRVILVKLADRLHNMRTLDVMPAEKKRRIAIETLDIYAPIAHRLGMHSFYIELEDLGFAARHPMRSHIIAKAVDKARGSRREIMQRIETELAEMLDKCGVPLIAIYSRQKHLYSIYKKMQQKNASFNDIMDVYGFRLVTQDNDTCYRVLGAVHQSYKPLPERFKDYIAIPKANGYQSLHTTLFGPYGVPIEVQIRTEEMDRVAENGIAAHWLYKASGLEASEAQTRARTWVKGLIEMQTRAGNPLEFIENVKIDLFPDEVYVFTPRGEILELPRGATPVDFAYMVHSDIGNGCVGARINRRIAPLSEPLANGQTVEVITAPGACPNPAWLNFVVTGKARGHIRHYLKAQEQEQLFALGKRLLDKALEDINASHHDIEEKALQELLAELSLQTVEQLYEAIGNGNQVAVLIAQRLTHCYVKGPKAVAKRHPLVIKGTEGMVVQYAECCRPIPNDPVVGIVQAGQGIVVHSERCPQVEKLRKQPERHIPLRWEENISRTFPAELIIEIVNQRGALAQVAAVLSDAETDISNINVIEQDGQFITLNLLIDVRGRQHLARVMRRMRKIPMTLKVIRRPYKT